MAFELFNQGPTTPARLHAVLRLVARRPGLTRQQIADMVQPKAVSDSENAVRDVLTTANSLGLVDMSGHSSAEIRLTVPRKSVEEVDDFRRTVAGIVLGVTDSAAPNYVFNLFTAWYAALDDDVFRRPPSKDIVVDFNERVFSTVEGQQMNDQKLAGWRPWAAFLGYGWLYYQARSGYVVPDCTDRVADVIEARLARERAVIPFRELRDHVAGECPELDGGVLFERAWQSGHGGVARGQTVSLMMSTALRNLHEAGRCRLESLADAADTWTLFPATGERFASVTHIAQGTGIADG